MYVLLRRGLDKISEISFKDFSCPRFHEMLFLVFYERIVGLRDCDTALSIMMALVQRIAVNLVEC